MPYHLPSLLGCEPGGRVATWASSGARQAGGGARSASALFIGGQHPLPSRRRRPNPLPLCGGGAGMNISDSNLRRCKIVHVKSGESDGYPKIEDMLVDEEILQSNLDKAIAEEDYARAAKIRDDLRILKEGAEASLLAANARFYSAFKNGDIAAMYSIWAKGDHVYVIHPAAGRISGYDVVMQSWEMVCNADYEFPLSIDLRNIEVHVRGNLGYVTCLEVVKNKGRTWGKQVATNIFEKVDGRWLISVHHASHIEE